MNETILRQAWDDNFESSPAMEKARLAALTAKMQRDAQYRTAQRQDPFNTQRLANMFRANMVNQGQSKEEIALAALQRFHDEEVSNYVRDRNEEQAAAFHSPVGFPYVARSEPDFANEFPWVQAGRAFQSAPIEPSRVVDVTRQRSLGSGTPFTAEDEVLAGNRYRYMPPQSAVDEIRGTAQAERDRRTQQAFDQRRAQQQGIQAMSRRQSPRLPNLTENDELSSMRSAASRPGPSQVRISDGWQSGGEFGELDSMALANEFEAPPMLVPVGSRPITPVGASTSSPVRAMVQPVAPWRIPGYPSW